MKKGVVLGILFVFLALGGAGGYWLLIHRPNQPTQWYVPVKGVTELSEADQDRMLDLWNQIAASDDVMSGLAKHTKITSHWGLSDEAIIKELRERAIIRIDKRTGLHIGFKGKKKETDELNNLAQTFFGYGSQIIAKNDMTLGEVLKSK